MAYINLQFMRFFTTKYIAFLSVVVGFGMMASCKKIDSTGTVNEKKDTTKTTPKDTSEVTKVDSTSLDMIAWYQFNNSAIDMTGNGHDGTVTNITSVSGRNGKANSAYYFDGSTSYVGVKDSAPLRLNNTDFTINSWIKLDAYNASSGSFVLSKRTLGYADGWGSSITGYSLQNGVGALGLAFFGPGGTDPFAISTKVVNTGTWYMITTVYTLSKQQVTFYINGVLDKTTTNIPSPNAAITAGMYIGRDNPASSSDGYYFKGAMDDVRIYKRALPVSQIQKLYTATY